MMFLPKLILVEIRKREIFWQENFVNYGGQSGGLLVPCCDASIWGGIHAGQPDTPTSDPQHWCPRTGGKQATRRKRDAVLQEIFAVKKIFVVAKDYEN